MQKAHGQEQGRRAGRLHVVVSETERAELRALAVVRSAAAGKPVSVSAVVREAALEAARREKETR